MIAGSQTSPEHFVAVGLRGQDSVADILRSTGRRVFNLGAAHLPYDLEVDGWHVEVKTSRLSHERWHFSFSEDQRFMADLYVLRLEGMPKTIHLAIRAPLSVQMIEITSTTLMRQQRFIDLAEEFSRFSAGGYGDGPRLEHLDKHIVAMATLKTYRHDVPDLLLRCRSELNLSLEDVGNQVGLTKKQISNIEQRISKPRRVNLLRIEDFLRKRGYLPKARVKAKAA
jgi:hypothetical protein